MPFADQQPSDPQSWNLYSYVRNNPLLYTDPTGNQADVEITEDKKNKTGTVVVKASFAVYAVPGGSVSQEELNKQAATLKSQIESGYSGTFTKGGIAYTVSAQISVQVVESEKAAIKSGAQNIVGVADATKVAAPNGEEGIGLGYRTPGESFDRMQVTKNGIIQDPAIFQHEFGHLLGAGSHTGPDTMMYRYAPRACN